MTLRFWRKHHIFAYPNAKFSFRKKVSLWHTTSLTQKHKAYYAKKKKFYSSMLQTSLDSPQIKPKMESKSLYWRTLYASSFWVFKNPIAVPGAVQIRRSKSLYINIQQNMKNLNTWYHRIPFRLLYKKVQSHSLVFLLETCWPSMLTKIGFVDTIGESIIVFKHKGFKINDIAAVQQKGKSIQTNFSIPGDIFMINP